MTATNDMAQAQQEEEARRWEEEFPPMDWSPFPDFPEADKAAYERARYASLKIASYADKRAFVSGCGESMHVFELSERERQYRDQMQANHDYSRTTKERRNG